MNTWYLFAYIQFSKADMQNSIIIIIVIFEEFFPSALVDGFPLEFEWLHVSSIIINIIIVCLFVCLFWLLGLLCLLIFSNFNI